MPPGQFRIYKSESHYAKQKVDESAERFQFDALCLEWSRPLHSTFLKGDDGHLLGIVLGHAFVLDTGERLSSKHVAGFNGDTYRAEDFEKLYESLFGSFLIIISLGRHFYLYPDAGGTLSAVYSKDSDIVGATAGAILSAARYASLFRDDLYNRLEVRNEGWFPAGLTAHRGVARLFCNHRLDLQTLTASRFWPKEAPRRSENPEAALEDVAKVVQDSVKIVYDNFNANQSLTGGFDARMLLALTGDFREGVRSYIIDLGPLNARDVYLAGKIAKAANVPHRILATTDDPGIRAQWRFRVGDAIGGLNEVIHTGLAPLVQDGVEAVIDGIGAETARCFLWREFDVAERIPTAQSITQRLGLHYDAEVVEAVQRWLDGLPEGDAFFVLDIAQLELRFSAWAYTQSYVDPPLLHFSPFVSRRSINALLSLPVETMRKGFGRQIVERREPALAKIPYNKWGDHRDWISPLVRSLRHPHLVTKKLRKMMAR